MKTFPGLILIATALTAQLPHLHGYPDALSKLMAIVDSMNTDQGGRVQDAKLQHTKELSGGIVTVCRDPWQNFNTLNPALSTLKDFRISLGWK